MNSTTETVSESWPRSRSRRGRLGIDWFSSMWVVLLLPAAAAFLLSPHPAWAKAVGAAGFIGFACVYIIGVNRSPSLERFTPDTGLREELTPLAAPLLHMSLFTIVTLVAAKWWAMCFVPFFAAFFLYTTRVRTGITGALTLMVLGVALARLGSSEPGVFQISLGSSASVLFVLLGRLETEQELRRNRQLRAEAAAAEREEIGRNVHDLLGHSLTVLTLKAEVAQRLIHRDPDAAERELAEIVTLSRAALADVRATATRLRTPDLASQIEATRTAFAAADIKATITGEASDIPLPQRELLAWALREATTNAVRHAAATQVLVRLSPGLLVVTDNGRGMGDASHGNGLTGLGARVKAAGGTMTITSPAPHQLADEGPGTELEVIL
ncbi:hypothetical protein HMPREF1531_00596 [Propionibacterium sp. oral taxon 192 str. F0372]|uniref:sensor histidine kinase n=1 Tax=Propionibacterium sp. oral taxon 192 TaxID=671222 RepID=UPI000352EE53|nr:histidine kinase [Propionibacterium sp. oral taxon 192]EPH05948.1 hypothetical protein HMPREF1531_00596 [Propionibacterium sp. oral taxon 192 str. F0372]